MAFTTFVMTVALVAITSAGYPGWPDEDNPFPGFPSPMMSSLRFGPIPPPLPMPGFPPLPMFNFFNRFPAFSIPAMPSAQDIANARPPPDGTYNGVVVSTKSELKRNPDGTVVREDGSTIVTNVDGEVHMYQTGNDPPRMIVSNPRASFGFDAPKHKPKLHKFKNFHNFDNFDSFHNFDNFGHKFPTMEPIDPAKMKDIKPGLGEQFKGHAISSHSYSSNINGVVKQGGGVVSVDNDNGKVSEENIAYHT